MACSVDAGGDSEFPQRENVGLYEKTAERHRGGDDEVTVTSDRRLAKPLSAVLNIFSETMV